MRNSILLLLVAACLGCAPSRSYQPRVGKSPGAGMARIQVTRIRNVSASVQPVYVLDRSAGAAYDLTLIEHPDNAEIRSGHKRNQGRVLYAGIADPDFRKCRVLVGKGPKITLGLDGQTRFCEHYETTKALALSHKEGELPTGQNAVLIGRVASGGSIEWDRPPGLTSIDLISPLQNLISLPETAVEAGRTYHFRFRYGGNFGTVEGGETP